MVDKADEELAAGNTGELLATLAPLLLETPSLNERSTAASLADAEKTDSEQQMVALTSAQRSEALGVLAEAARAEAVKALRGANKPDSIAKADRALAAEVRARGALFYAAAKFLTPESMAEGDVERDPGAITNALPNLIACLRGAVELRGPGALAPDGGVGFNRRESIDGLRRRSSVAAPRGSRRRRLVRARVCQDDRRVLREKAHHPPGEVPKERRRAKEQVERKPRRLPSRRCAPTADDYPAAHLARKRRSLRGRRRHRHGHRRREPLPRRAQVRGRAGPRRGARAARAASRDVGRLQVLLRRRREGGFSAGRAAPLDRGSQARRYGSRQAEGDRRRSRGCRRRGAREGCGGGSTRARG